MRKNHKITSFIAVLTFLFGCSSSENAGVTEPVNVSESAANQKSNIGDPENIPFGKSYVYEFIESSVNEGMEIYNPEVDYIEEYNAIYIEITVEDYEKDLVDDIINGGPTDTAFAKFWEKRKNDLLDMSKSTHNLIQKYGYDVDVIYNMHDNNDVIYIGTYNEYIVQDRLAGYLD